MNILMPALCWMDADGSSTRAPIQSVGLTCLPRLLLVSDVRNVLDMVSIVKNVLYQHTSSIPFIVLR